MEHDSEMCVFPKNIQKTEFGIWNIRVNDIINKKFIISYGDVDYFGLRHIAFFEKTQKYTTWFERCCYFLENIL